MVWYTADMLKITSLILILSFWSLPSQASFEEWQNKIYSIFNPLESNDINYVTRSYKKAKASCNNRIVDHYTNIYVLEQGKKDYHSSLERLSLQKTLTKCRLRLQQYEARIEILRKARK